MQSKPLLFVKLFLALVVVTVFGFYFFHQSKAFLLGPDIIISYPLNGQIFEDSFIKINGHSINANLVLLNDRKVIIDNLGNFEEMLLLARGYNIIEVTAEDKFGRVVKEKLEVVLR